MDERVVDLVEFGRSTIDVLTVGSILALRGLRGTTATGGNGGA